MSQAPAFLAIIPPKPELNWLSDSIASREGPIRVAVMIAIVALFVIAWALLSENLRQIPPN